MEGYKNMSDFKMKAGHYISFIVSGATYPFFAACAKASCVFITSR